MKLQVAVTTALSKVFFHTTQILPIALCYKMEIDLQEQQDHVLGVHRHEEKGIAL